MHGLKVLRDTTIEPEEHIPEEVHSLTVEVKPPEDERQQPVAQVSPVLEDLQGVDLVVQVYIYIYYYCIIYHLLGRLQRQKQNIALINLYMFMVNKYTIQSSTPFIASAVSNTYVLIYFIHSKQYAESEVHLLINQQPLMQVSFRKRCRGLVIVNEWLLRCLGPYVLNDKYNRDMKSELINALTHYNDDAQLDQEHILDLKKSMFEREISTSNRILSNTSTDFCLKPINVGFLNSSFLNDNPHFKEIKQAFYNYNLEVANMQGEAGVDDRHLRPKLMDSLLKFMRLIMLTEDRVAQGRMLGVVNAWFKEILAKREYKTKLQREFDRQLEQRLAESRLAAKPPPSNLPSEIIKGEKAAYKRKFRTLHEDLHAPSERLKDFKRRILNFEEAELKPSSVPPASRIKYERPPPLIFHKDAPELGTEPVSKEQKPNQNASITTAANVSTDADAAKTVPTEPVIGESAKQEDNQPEELMLGEEPGEDDLEEPEPDLPDEEGKLDPNTKNYIYPPNAYNSQAEIRMNERVLKIQSDIERRNRQDHAKYESTKEWSKQRCRLQAQISRKIESVREFAKAQQKILKAKTEPNERFINLSKEQQIIKPRFEDSIDQKHLAEAKSYGHRYINYQKLDLINHSKGLSIFDRKRAKTQTKSLSQILNQHSMQKQRDASFSEIEQIKNRFAKYKIPVELKRVSDGLLPPKGIQQEKLEKIGPADVSLPSNPFMKVAKKKRKGKKK